MDGHFAVEVNASEDDMAGAREVGDLELVELDPLLQIVDGKEINSNPRHPAQQIELVCQGAELQAVVSLAREFVVGSMTAKPARSPRASRDDSIKDRDG